MYTCFVSFPSVLSFLPDHISLILVVFRYLIYLLMFLFYLLWNCFDLLSKETCFTQFHMYCFVFVVHKYWSYLDDMSYAIFTFEIINEKYNYIYING